MKRRIFTFLLAALVLLTACSGRGTEPPVRIGEAIGEASLLRSYSAAEAFQEADTVALVRVGDWLGEQDGGFPITFYKAAVVKSYKGDLPREFTLMQNGGSAGTYEDYPLYTCGNELLVFLRKADADYPDAYQSVGSFSTVLYAADAVDGTRYYLDRFGLMSMREQDPHHRAHRQSQHRRRFRAVLPQHRPQYRRRHAHGGYLHHRLHGYSPNRDFTSWNRSLICRTSIIMTTTSPARVGIEPKLMQAIADKLGMELVWEQVDFDSIIPGIQAGRYDAGVAGISITADRLKNCDFSDPYFLANQVIVVNPGSDIQSKADLTGKTIAVQTGTTAETYCLDNGYEILSFASNIDAQAALTSGKADAWVVDNEVAVKMAGEQNLTVLDEAMTSEPYALAFAKGSDLVDQVNQALSQLLQDGTVEQIFQEYDTVYVSPLS